MTLADLIAEARKLPRPVQLELCRILLRDFAVSDDIVVASDWVEAMVRDISMLQELIAIGGKG